MNFFEIVVGICLINITVGVWAIFYTVYECYDPLNHQWKVRR